MFLFTLKNDGVLYVEASSYASALISAELKAKQLGDCIMASYQLAMNVHDQLLWERMHVKTLES